MAEKNRSLTRTNCSPKTFAQLVKKHRADGPGLCPLTNFTFWLGAGFSKSWADSYPDGKQLFKVPGANRTQIVDVERAANFESAPPPPDRTNPDLPPDLTISDIRQIIYSIDMNLRYSAIRSRYLDEHNLIAAKSQLAAYICQRFQALVNPDWYWFDPKDNKFTLPATLTRDQGHIRSLFATMFKSMDGSRGVVEGARFNFVTTNYDWLVEAIIDSVTGADDSSLHYLYRGVTPASVCGQSLPRVVHDHSLVFNLLKLNGGFEVFPNGDGFDFDYRKRIADDYSTLPPTLMFPSREQNYASDYFTALFPKAVRLLQESKVLVIIGYSLPDDDALLRFLLHQFCEDRADASQKYLFYVGPSPEKTQFERVQKLFPFAGIDLRVALYSGSFADWCHDVVTLL